MGLVIIEIWLLYVTEITGVRHYSQPCCPLRGLNPGPQLQAAPIALHEKSSMLSTEPTSHPKRGDFAGPVYTHTELPTL